MVDKFQACVYVVHDKDKEYTKQKKKSRKSIMFNIEGNKGPQRNNLNLHF